MTFPRITFSSLLTPTEETVVLLADDRIAVSPEAEALIPLSVLKRVASITGFTGKVASSVELIAPAETDYERVVAVGIGSGKALAEENWARIGGTIYAVTLRARDIAVLAQLPETPLTTDDLATLVLGILMRSYSFDKYRTSKADDGARLASEKQFTIICADPDAARARLPEIQAIAEGVLLARDLVNEPANILGTLEFVSRAKELEPLGVEIEVLTESQMAELGMGALLGVAQGSVRPPRLVVMRWNGGNGGDAPVAFIGKGVVFDSGGISIKPAASMEDMKGDMGGAAAVVGLIHVLATRKARANVVGVVGLVENMVDGSAQRPGDIVTSMSGQTIEILNTDAEGRLILADALWYTSQRFNPRFLIDLATLTGAILVALGHEHAGLYANDDNLAEALTEAGHVTGERLWRMPLLPAYDKLIDSKIADMKNIGGRMAGSVTAAKFLQRFVKDRPWAHLDIAGTAFGAPESEINQSWASGFGVRLLDRFMRNAIEANG